jgi:tetratricopeptide (TPR) repeat protein
MQTANEIDPLSRRILVNLLAVRDFRHEFDQARPLLERIVNLQTDDPDNVRLLSIEYLLEENYAKVIEIGNEVHSNNGVKRTSNYLTANLAVAYARTGQTAKANELLAYLESRAKNDSEIAFRLAMACSDLGRKDEAIHLLQQSFAAHDDRMVWLKVEPRFDPLRDDPRFQELLQKMNL